MAGNSQQARKRPATEGRGGGNKKKKEDKAGIRSKKKSAQSTDRSDLTRNTPKPKGLTNLGHSCYVNCILQLINSSAVPALFLHGGFAGLLDTTSTSPKLKVVQELDAVVQAMHRDASVMPAGFLLALCEAAGLPQQSMQDAHECWTALLDCLNSVVLDMKTPGACHFNPCGGLDGGDTLGSYCFGSMFRSTLQCQECGHKSVRDEAHLDLQVPLPARPNTPVSSKSDIRNSQLSCIREDGEDPMNEEDKEQGCHDSKTTGQMSRANSTAYTNSGDTSTQDNGSRMDSRQSTPSAAAGSLCGGIDGAGATAPKLEVGIPTQGSTSVHLDQALEMVFSAEQVEGVKCEGCGLKPGASKQTSIDRLPRGLVIQVKRFQQNVKLRGHIVCPINLNMLRFCTAAIEAQERFGSGCATTKHLEALAAMGSQLGAMYALKVLVEHRGKGLNSGHFVAYVHMGERWHLCNDKSVVEVDYSQDTAALKVVLCCGVLEYAAIFWTAEISVNGMLQSSPGEASPNGPTFRT